MITSPDAHAPGPTAVAAILVDSSAWVHHFRSHDSFIDAMLSRAMARTHPDVVGELAMGRNPEAALCRNAVIGLPAVEPVDRFVLLGVVDGHAMNGVGIGWVDAGLLAACMRSPEPLAIYTRDRAMSRVARSLGIPVVDPDQPA